MEMGLDSLATTQLVRQLSGRFELQLPLNVLFDHPSVESLAEYIKGLLSTPDKTGKGSVADVGGSGDDAGIGDAADDCEDEFVAIEVSPETSLAIADLITTGVHPQPASDLLVCVQKGHPSVAPVVFTYGAMGWKVGSLLANHVSADVPVG